MTVSRLTETSGDVFDALCSDRPYRKAWPFARVLHHIQEQSGSHFDPVVVSAFGELCATRPDQVFGLYGPEACQPASAAVPIYV